MRRSANDTLLLEATYPNWNSSFVPQVFDGQNTEVSSGASQVDYTRGSLRVTGDSGNEDYFVTYEFDICPGDELKAMMEMTLQEMNVAGAADGGYLTSYTTVDSAPIYWDALVAIGVVAKVFRRLASDSGLWKNYLIWADGDAGQRLAQETAQHYQSQFELYIRGLKKIHYIASPTQAFGLFTSIGFGFFSVNGGKFREMRVNRMMTY